MVQKGIHGMTGPKNVQENVQLRALLALERSLCLSSHESGAQLLGCLPQDPQWNPHPECIEEDEIQPEVDWVLGNKRGASGEPLGRKGHEATVQLCCG